jgi:hypothetical protein
MVHMRFGPHALVAFAAAAIFAGCGGSSQPQQSQAFCPFTVPFVELLYPIPGSRDVSPNIGQMVFTGTGVARVQLAKRFYPYHQGRIATKPEALPNPLPTPLATPGPYGQFLTTTFAVSFKTLQPHTKYEVRAWAAWNGAACNAGSEPQPPGWEDDASFVTQ